MIASLFERVRQPTIYRRVIAIAMMLLIVAVLYLVYLQERGRSRQHYANAATVAASQLGYVGREFRQSNITPLARWKDSSRVHAGELLFSICDDQNATVYNSQDIVAISATGACNAIPKHSEELPFRAITLDNQLPYFLIPFPIETDSKPITVVLIRPASAIQEVAKQQTQTMVIKTIALLLALFVLLVAGARWGVQPLLQLRDQLQEIISGKRDKLEHIKAREVQGTAQAINELLEQTTQRKQIYQDAMNDLAHSLKTRIAAINALLDDQHNPQQRLLLEQQLIQMDELVQYQLRKAVLGRQGLKQEFTNALYTCEQLKMMLHKVHAERHIRCDLLISPEQQISCNATDLMELLGNTMDNAFRFANKQVVVSLNQSIEQTLLTIEDDGPGIDEDKIERIVRRGERADERSEGQGIGLAVCEEICLSYGGMMSIERSPMGGAKIAFKLPNDNRFA
ncbi:sensor histidine kinase [Ferrimonas lipolytica]|uniref:histidine kinase n=1 Tax=Ferrimonas lipolytica TaxID=2724191 RepID=A0A6H1UEY8_9GAMM|nr:sensor histidine kinase [Ferrimonas lipolytica]QIZ76776.1 sensor histidine kinase [Ferrimonas lipolytica]